MVNSSSISPFMVMSALRLLRADLHVVCSRSFLKLVGEALEFTREVNVIRESQNGGVVVLESHLHCFRKGNIKQDGEKTPGRTPSDILKKSPICLFRSTLLQLYCAVGVSEEFLDNSHQPIVNVEPSQNLPKAIVQHAIESFLEVNEVVEKLSLVSQVFLNDNALFHSAPPSAESCLLFNQQFSGLTSQLV
ncbi:hypothetical protein DPMN_143494 [Dreissena polymorpha]|uniref:Uncharacterized protein n=1 Tax=Dreissena polymorpha TaxID=45954 RepID=A0A9D4GJ55_DREPO|nr:hypothetical protein DPMN_143439 [Dreissena polymorpha]KAH3814975.1 hypothetical protein DPMN_143494 [Dreissena polymorpha]